MKLKLRPRNRQRGVAMLIVITWLALMISLVGEFTYGTSVDAAQAANARDELRAHYLARSSVSLSRLLIKIQQQYVDPIQSQLSKMLSLPAVGRTRPAPRLRPAWDSACASPTTPAR